MRVPVKLEYALAIKINIKINVFFAFTFSKLLERKISLIENIQIFDRLLIFKKEIVF